VRGEARVPVLRPAVDQAKPPLISSWKSRNSSTFPPDSRPEDYATFFATSQPFDGRAALAALNWSFSNISRYEWAKARTPLTGQLVVDELAGEPRGLLAFLLARSLASGQRAITNLANDLRVRASGPPYCMIPG
jgi:hypothetical protein